jgi:hypothetical protein
VTARPQYSTAELSERLRSFPILPDESTTAYENRAVAIGHGHLVIKQPAVRAWGGRFVIPIPQVTVI